MPSDHAPHPFLTVPGALSRLVPAAGIAGALLLLAAELTTLFSVHTSIYHSAVRTVSAGAHNGFSLVPVALLGAVLSVGPGRGHRAARVALLAAGLLALAIALIVDLPDTRAHGLTPGLALASNSAGPAVALETLGAILLVFAGGIAAFGARARE